MNDQEQRIAIAEACGWERKETIYRDGSSAGFSWVSPDGVGRPLPDYLTDLNAMNGAETSLTDDEYKRFHYHLTKLRNTQCEHPNICRCISAPAKERAIAYLQAINNWHD